MVCQQKAIQRVRIASSVERLGERNSHSLSFRRYMDAYRDPKKISKEVLVKKLKTHHPFTPPEPPLEFPEVHTRYDHGDKASWVQVAVKKERMKWGKIYNDNIDIIEPR